jgi:CRP-like cAMP-binding protein
MDANPPKGLPEIRARRVHQAQPQFANLLTQEQQLRLREIAELVEFRGNEPVFAEGAQAEYMYMVASGMVRISRRAASGRQQVISFLLAGDIFGQLPEEGFYINSAMAMGSTALYRIRLARLEELLRLEPQLQHNFLVRMAFDLRQAQKRILVLGQQNVSQRLASFLLELMEHGDFYDDRQKQLSLPLSRFDLGDYLGTSPETVVRVLSRLENDGLIKRLSSRLLLIPSRDALARLLRGRRRNDG